MAGVVNWSTAGAWTDAFAAANFNALANGSGIISSATVVSNVAAKLFCDLSFITVTSTFLPTAAAGASLDFYLLALTHNGTVYDDGATGTTTSQAAPRSFAGRIIFQLTTAAHNGMVRGLVVPNGTFKFYIVNNTGAALPASATNMTCQYRLYSYNMAGV